jgi:hypothetical protein
VRDARSCSRPLRINCVAEQDSRTMKLLSFQVSRSPEVDLDLVTDNDRIPPRPLQEKEN